MENNYFKKFILILNVIIFIVLFFIVDLVGDGEKYYFSECILDLIICDLLVVYFVYYYVYYY